MIKISVEDVLGACCLTFAGLCFRELAANKKPTLEMKPGPNPVADKVETDKEGGKVKLWRWIREKRGRAARRKKQAGAWLAEVCDLASQKGISLADAEQIKEDLRRLYGKEGNADAELTHTQTVEIDEEGCIEHLNQNLYGKLKCIYRNRSHLNVGYCGGPVRHFQVIDWSLEEMDRVVEELHSDKSFSIIPEEEHFLLGWHCGIGDHRLAMEDSGVHSFSYKRGAGSLDTHVYVTLCNIGESVNQYLERLEKVKALFGLRDIVKYTCPALRFNSVKEVKQHAQEDCIGYLKRMLRHGVRVWLIHEAEVTLGRSRLDTKVFKVDVWSHEEMDRVVNAAHEHFGPDLNKQKPALQVLAEAAEFNDSWMEPLIHKAMDKLVADRDARMMERAKSMYPGGIPEGPIEVPQEIPDWMRYRALHEKKSQATNGKADSAEKIMPHMDWSLEEQRKLMECLKESGINIKWVSLNRVKVYKGQWERAFKWKGRSLQPLVREILNEWDRFHQDGLLCSCKPRDIEKIALHKTPIMCSEQKQAWLDHANEVFAKDMEEELSLPHGILAREGPKSHRATEKRFTAALPGTSLAEAEPPGLPYEPAKIPWGAIFASMRDSRIAESIKKPKPLGICNSETELVTKEEERKCLGIATKELLQ